MKFSEVDPTFLREMSFAQKKVEAVIESLEEPINVYLIKLLCAIDRQAESHWCKELIGWLARIRRLRLKPDHRPPSSQMVFELLFNQPFEGHEVRNVYRLVRDVADEIEVEDVELEIVVDRVKRFHRQFADLVHKGDASKETVRDLLNQL